MRRTDYLPDSEERLEAAVYEVAVDRTMRRPMTGIERVMATDRLMEELDSCATQTEHRAMVCEYLGY